MFRSKRTRRSAASVASVSVFSTAVAVLALTDPGYLSTDVELHDAGVWVTKSSSMQLGRFNYEAQAIDGAVVAGSDALEVLQRDGLVLLVDEAASTVTLVDPAAVEASGSVTLPEGAQVTMGGDVVAVWEPDGGGVWAMPAAELLSFSAEEDAPLLDAGAGVDVAVGVDGTVAVADPESGSVTVVPTAAGVVGDAQTRDVALPAEGDLQLTLVGTTPVVLAPATGDLILPGETLAVDGEGARIQEPGPGAETVALATRDGLVLQPLDGSAAAVIEAEGDPAAPLRVGSCTYAAWSSGDVVRDCGDGDPFVETLPGVTGEVRYRTNRGYVVLNDLATGTVWLADQEYTEHNDWDDIVPAQDPSAEEAEDPATETEKILAERDLPNRPPVAQDDTFGVRPGRTAVLTVLDNDTDADGDVLRATPDSDPSFGEAQAVMHGAAIQVFVPEDATGTATFGYTLDDGREKGTDTATVTLEVHASGVNAGPEQIRPTRAVVEQGSSTQVDVLNDWRDPDGDVLQLVGAQTAGTGDAVRFTADGRVTFVDGGTELAAKTVTVSVSDGQTVTEGTVDLTVIAKGVNEPPVAGVDHVSALVGRPIEITPLTNDTDANGDVLRLARVDDVAGLTVDRNLDAGLLTVTASAPGVYYLEYLVSDGPSAAVGLVRVDVVAESAEGLAPVAVRDRALLPAGESVLVDVLANDTDPAGGVLVVQSVDVDPSFGASVAVVNHAMLRLTAIRLGPAPFTLTYTVSNGTGSAQGEVLVLPVTPQGESQSPQAVEDVATVRAGDVVDIDVLANDSHPDGLPLSVDPVLVNPPDAVAARAFVSEDVLRVHAGATEQTVYLTYTVRDRQGHKDSAQVTVHITALDAASNAAPSPATVTARVVAGERTRIAIPLDGIDPDGDSVELTGLSRAPTMGRVTAVGDGWLEYEPSRGVGGTDSFGYYVEDRFGAVGEGAVVVGIAPAQFANQPPVAVDDRRTVRPGRVLSVPVLANDVDPEADTLRLSGDPVSSDGLSVKVDVDQLVVTAPVVDGTYAVQYGLSDGTSTAVGVLTLTVDPAAPELAPIARDDRLALADVVGRTEVAIDVLANDEDPDGSRTTLRVSSDVTGVRVSAAGELVVPVLADAQVVPYTVTDEQGDTADAFVRLPGVGSARPTLRKDLAEIQVFGGQELIIDLADYVVVAEDRTVRLTLAEKVAALRGVARVVDEDTIGFTSEDLYYGPAAVTFEVIDTALVDDPTGRTATLSLPITVLPSGAEPPEVVAPEFEAPISEPTRLDLTRYATDPNGDALTFRVTDVPDELSAEVDGTALVVEPAGGTPIGTVLMFSVWASDGDSDVEATATVTVTSSSAPPITVVDDEYPTANAGETYPVEVLANDVSPIPGTDLDVVSVLLEAGEGDVTSDGRTVTATPAAGFVGTMVIAYTVGDVTGDPARWVVGRLRLTVRDVPEAPGTPTVVEVRSHTAVISWAPPMNNGAEITHYLITVNGRNGGTLEATATTWTVEELVNDTPYTFQVVAVNEVGESAPSPQSAEIRPDAIPDPPAAPVLTFGDGFLEVDWTNRDYAGERSAITAVDLEISPPPPSGIAQKTAVAGTSTVWEGLENGTAYQVRVRAVNKAGASDWSSYSASEIPAGVPDAPGTPSASLPTPVGANAEMVVTWTAPAADNGDAVKSYLLHVYQGGSTPVQTLTLGPVLSTAITLGTSPTAYTFAVIAQNKAGDSAPSALSAPRQAVNPPGAVTGVQAWPTDAGGTPLDGRLRIVFTPLGTDQLNGAATSQVSYQYSLNGGAWAALSSALVPATNGSNYTVQVRARTSANSQSYDGPATAATYPGPNSTAGGVRPYGPPQRPDARVTESAANAMTLEVVGVDRGCGLTIHYRVDGGSWQTTSSTWSQRWTGYNQSHSVEAYTTDACGSAQSATDTASATTPPPPPTGTVSRGAAFYDATDCTDPSCAYVHLEYQNVPTGNHLVRCQSDTNNDGVFSDWHSYTRNFTASNGGFDTVCFFGYNNEPVRIVVDGVLTTPSIPW